MYRAFVRVACVCDHSLVSQADVSAGTIRVFINTVPIGVLVGPAGTSAAFHSDVSPLSPVVRASLPATRTGTRFARTTTSRTLAWHPAAGMHPHAVGVRGACLCFMLSCARVCVRNWRLVLVCVFHSERTRACLLFMFPCVYLYV